MPIQLATKPQTEALPPRWACELAGGHSRSCAIDGFDLTVTEGAQASLMTVRAPQAVTQDAGRFEQSVTDIYQVIHSELAACRHTQPVRYWNYLPAIHQPMDGSRDRYMVFNAGRFKALRKWFGGDEAFPDRLPAASGVGHDGDDLIIHCLSFAHPGTNIDNPRQIPAFRYSPRYGPLPPCFARATRISLPEDGRTMLIAAGTASIRGEQSVHVGDLRRQMSETLENLRSLLAVAAHQANTPVALGAFTAIRIYHLHSRDAAEIETSARHAFGAGAQIEIVRADLCRSDLLVEIEGIARLDPGELR